MILTKSLSYKQIDMGLTGTSAYISESDHNEYEMHWPKAAVLLSFADEKYK